MMGPQYHDPASRTAIDDLVDQCIYLYWGIRKVAGVEGEKPKEGTTCYTALGIMRRAQLRSSKSRVTCKSYPEGMSHDVYSMEIRSAYEDVLGAYHELIRLMLRVCAEGKLASLGTNYYDFISLSHWEQQFESPAEAAK